MDVFSPFLRDFWIPRTLAQNVWLERLGVNIMTSKYWSEKSWPERVFSDQHLLATTFLRYFYKFDPNSDPKVPLRMGPRDQHIVKTDKNLMFFHDDFNFHRKNCIVLRNKSCKTKCGYVVLLLWPGLQKSKDYPFLKCTATNNVLV